MDLQRKTAGVGTKTAQPGNQRSWHCSPGFTMMEVIFAILILSTSLVVLLGLQTASMQKAVRDRNQQQAMLVARSILAAIEIEPDSIEVGNKTQPAYDLLKSMGMIDADDREAKDRLAAYEVNLMVEQVAIPFQGLDFPLGMNQIVLTVFWGDQPQNNLQVVYFVAQEN